MDVRIEQKITVSISKAEWLLISKGLRGVLKPGPEAAEALDLQERMHQQRHAILVQTLSESQKVIDNIARGTSEDL